MAATSRDEFVDLYEVMDLPVEADSETIRLRLNTLYLEAQQNLDHRNVKKRLQYQQMYEIYLPQGRHLLLEPRRRAEYDRYLAAYRTGNKVAPSTDPVAEPFPSVPTVVEEPPIPGMAEVQVDPEVLAAEREDVWAKWKVGLEAVGEQIADVSDTLPGTDSAPAIATTSSAITANHSPDSAANSSQARPAPPTPRGYTAPTPRPRAAGGPQVGRTAPPAPRAGSATRTPPLRRKNGPNFEEPPAPDTNADLEKQREQQRYALIRDAVQNAGLLWGAIYGGGIFFVGLILLRVLDNALKPRYPLGLTQAKFALIGLFIILAATAFGGLIARRKAKRRAVSQFSLLSTEELMRRSRI